MPCALPYPRTKFLNITTLTIGGPFLCHSSKRWTPHIFVSTLTSKTSPLSLSHCPWSSQGALQTSPELRLWGFLRYSVVFRHHVVHEWINEWKNEWMIIITLKATPVTKMPRSHFYLYLELPRPELTPWDGTMRALSMSWEEQPDSWRRTTRLGHEPLKQIPEWPGAYLEGPGSQQ